MEYTMGHVILCTCTVVVKSYICTCTVVVKSYIVWGELEGETRQPASDTCPLLPQTGTLRPDWGRLFALRLIANAKRVRADGWANSVSMIRAGCRLTRDHICMSNYAHAMACMRQWLDTGLWPISHVRIRKDSSTHRPHSSITWLLHCMQCFLRHSPSSSQCSTIKPKQSRWRPKAEHLGTTVCSEITDTLSF